MHPAAKILVGAIMIATGAYTSITFLDQLTAMILGGLGPLLIVIGGFIVWLESDEWKMNRQDKENNKKSGLQEQLNTAKTIREQQKKQQQNEQNNQERNNRKIQRDYTDILEGTVEEAKDRINGMDNVNYDTLIAAERRDKNRKTLIQWLERQKE